MDLVFAEKTSSCLGGQSEYAQDGNAHNRSHDQGQAYPWEICRHAELQKSDQGLGPGKSPQESTAMDVMRSQSRRVHTRPVNRIRATEVPVSPKRRLWAARSRMLRVVRMVIGIGVMI